jgi:hypothetical protein
MNEDGRIEVFCRGPDRHLWHIRQDPASSSGFSSWFLFKDPSLDVHLAGPPAVCSNADGSLLVFAQDTSGTLVFRAQARANVDIWETWQSLGDRLTNPDVAPAMNADGRAEVCYVGKHDEMFSRFQNEPNKNLRDDWGGPDARGGKLVSPPALSRNGDGRLEAFHIGRTGRLYNAWQLSPGGAWSGWDERKTAKLKGSPCVVRNVDNRLEVFALDHDGNMWHAWQTAPNSAPWLAEHIGGATLAVGLGSVSLAELGCRSGFRRGE